MFRDVDNTKAINDFITNQYKSQIKKVYNVDPRFVSKAREMPAVLHYMPIVYSQIVVPMENKLKNVMFNFRLQTEASLYASDLKYNLSDDPSSNSGGFQSQGSSLSDDNLWVLNNQLGKIIDRYESIFNKICSAENKFNHPLDLT